MTKTTDPLDSRTDPVLVWDQLKNLTREELIQWRVAPLHTGQTAEERNINLPIPFGWFAICYSDELQTGEVKPLHYFDKELVVWRGDDGDARVLDAYCPHLGAHMGYGARLMAITCNVPSMPGAGMVKALLRPFLIRNPSHPG